jgi:hypothetical protein
MKNRFVHYKIHSIELLWWFQSNYQCVVQIENITNRILLYPDFSLGRCGNSIERSYFETFLLFFLRKIHFAISTAQKNNT